MLAWSDPNERASFLVGTVDSTRDIDWSYVPINGAVISPIEREMLDTYRFKSPGDPYSTEFYLDQDVAGPGNFGTGTAIGGPEIFGHITPSRARALGSVTDPYSSSGEVSSAVDLGGAGFGFTDEAYDHSAQYLSSYKKRKAYWDSVLEKLGFASIQ